jgi:hypothetical protein
MTKPTSFETDIRPLFTERDIQGMSKALLPFTTAYGESAVL